MWPAGPGFDSRRHPRALSERRSDHEDRSSSGQEIRLSTGKRRVQFPHGPPLPRHPSPRLNDRLGRSTVGPRIVYPQIGVRFPVESPTNNAGVLRARQQPSKLRSGVRSSAPAPRDDDEPTKDDLPVRGVADLHSTLRRSRRWFDSSRTGHGAVVQWSRTWCYERQDGGSIPPGPAKFRR